MRVDLTTYGLEPPDKSRDKTEITNTTGTAQQSNNVTGADQTSFSFDPTRVNDLQAQAMAQPDVREQKVELLRQAIGKGEYAVHESQVADALLADVQGAAAH